MELKGKIKSVVLYKAQAYNGNDAYNVMLEGDDRRFSYGCKGQPKLKEGMEDTFIIENKGKDGKDWWQIKVKQDNAFGGGFKGRPSNEFALEQARKMYNSSNQLEHPIQNKLTIDTTKTIATHLLGLINKGVNKAAIETACTIACSKMTNGTDLVKGELDAMINIFNDWLKTNN